MGEGGRYDDYFSVKEKSQSFGCGQSTFVARRGRRGLQIVGEKR